MLKQLLSHFTNDPVISVWIRFQMIRRNNMTIHFTGKQTKCCNTFMCGRWFLEWRMYCFCIEIWINNMWIIWKFVAAITGADHPPRISGLSLRFGSFESFFCTVRKKSQKLFSELLLFLTLNRTCPGYIRLHIFILVFF